MCEKEYYYYGNSEFMTGLGVIYTEFTGQRASRQINVLNGHSYCFLLPTGFMFQKQGFYSMMVEKMSQIYQTPSRLVKRKFERIWAQAVASGQNET